MKDASSVQQGEEGCCLQSFVEGILSLFFSKHRGTFHEEDCKYYLELANKQHSTLSIDKCLSMSMLKLYLARILGSGEPEHGPSSQVNIINCISSTVCVTISISLYRLKVVPNPVTLNSFL